MLTSPLPALLSLAALAVPAPLLARTAAPERPPGLVVLDERPTPKGPQVLGVYGMRFDPADPDLRRVQLWRQLVHEVSLTTDTLGCSPRAPMRMTRVGDRWVVRELNPGGPVTLANRVDHLVWWAVCHPEQAGKDPATLAALARQLGYSGELRESEQVLPGRAR
ncbi:MAG: hypothetical protein WBN89_05710 [Prochlorococcaceae cyanobacterium]